ncbi:MAG: hypothetical protein NTY32_09730 [Bacteroidia bacterium]|nr:hypothetical protein [Bacteroidia bacterium]
MKHVKLLFLAVLLNGFSSVFAGEIVLAKYDFSTKSKVPVINAPGVVFGSEFGIWNSSIYAMEAGISDDGYMLIRSYGTNVASDRYGYISITPDAGKSVKISKVVIKHFKVDGSNTKNTRCYLYDMGQSTPKDIPTIVSNLISAGNGGSTIPAVLTEQTFNSTTPTAFSAIRFMSFSATQTTADAANLSQWKILELTIYGTVVTPGDIVVTDAINYGNVLAGNSVDNTVALKVEGGTTSNVAIEMIDPTNSFSCLQTLVEAIDATAGTAIKVSYVPTVPGKHTAQMKFTYDDKVAYTTLSGVCPVLNESFTTFVSDPLIWATMYKTMVNGYNQADYLTVTGWQFTDSVSWFNSPSYGLGLELHGSKAMVAKVTTPELDLSTPFGLTFRARKTDNRTTILGQMYVLADQDTIWSYVNPNNSLSLRTVDGFIAKPNSKISFVGLADDSSKVVVDEIAIFPTTTPTLNLPAYSTKLFSVGTEPVTVEIPFKAYQLTTDVIVGTIGTAVDYEILTPTISKADAEAGSTIQIKYTPTFGLPTNADLEIKGGGLTDYRYLKLMANSTTSLKENKLRATVYGKTQAIRIAVDEKAILEVFTYDGRLLVNKQITGSTDVQVKPGLYIVKLRNKDVDKIVKVSVK